MAYQLRQRKTELLKARPLAAGAARSQLALSLPDASTASLEKLRSIDRELADTENALDKVYDMVRPGADRQALHPGLGSNV